MLSTGEESDPPNGVLGQALFWRKCLVLILCTRQFVYRILLSYLTAYTTWRSLHIPSLTYCVDFFNFMILIISLLVTCLDVSDKPIYLSSEVRLMQLACIKLALSLKSDSPYH